ncbi:MAG: hypothetical protein HY289_05315 [Planctomycetes bacterium]|nr:hypothetical protein [Planctomycetota bacterium]
MARVARCFVFLAFVGWCSTLPAQDEVKKKATTRRFGFDVDGDTFPQKSPDEAMKSIVKALNRDKVDYLLAQMADPAYVDYWVDQYKVQFTEGKDEGKRLLAFDRLTRETILYFQNDPLIVKDLKAFAKEAKWTEEGDLATGVVESLPARKVFLRKVGERWFLKNEQQ